MRRSSTALIIALLLATMIVAACARQTSGQPARQPLTEPWTGVMADVSAVWSAEPGIELFTGPAVVVRAYMESRALASATGTIDVVYPGFTRAVLSPAETGDMPGTPWPGTSRPLPFPLVGTDRSHILRIDTVGRAVTAIVCSYSRYTSTYDLGNGKYGPHPGDADDDGVVAMQVMMTAPITPTTLLPPQRGPARSPTADVFGDWRIDSRRLDMNEARPEWPTALEDVQACRDRAPDPLERRKFLRQGEHPQSDYPTLPAYPGWPEAQTS